MLLTMRNPMIPANRRSRLTASTVVLGTIALVVGCGPQAKTNHPNAATNPAQPNATNASIAAAPTNSNNLPVPGIPPIASAQMPTLPIAGLTPASDPKAVGAKAQPKQGDPFAPTTAMSFTVLPVISEAKPTAPKSALKPQGKTAKPTAKGQNSRPTGPLARINPAPIAQRPRPAVQRNLNIPAFPQPQTIAAVPVIQPIAPPRPPVPSVSAPVIAVPNVAIPRAAAAAPVAPSAPMAEAIAITGVMQTNGRTMVIAQAPNTSARYVEAGDSIGAVRVKSIQVSRSGEPVVVLEQNGVTVTKSVGAR
jgi:hypothetical protein